MARPTGTCSSACNYCALHEPYHYRLLRHGPGPGGSGARGGGAVSGAAAGEPDRARALLRPRPHLLSRRAGGLSSDHVEQSCCAVTRCGRVTRSRDATLSHSCPALLETGRDKPILGTCSKGLSAILYSNQSRKIAESSQLHGQTNSKSGKPLPTDNRWLGRISVP